MLASLLHRHGWVPRLVRRPPGHASDGPVPLRQPVLRGHLRGGGRGGVLPRREMRVAFATSSVSPRSSTKTSPFLASHAAPSRSPHASPVVASHAAPSPLPSRPSPLPSPPLLAPLPSVASLSPVPTPSLCSQSRSAPSPVPTASLCSQSCSAPSLAACASRVPSPVAPPSRLPAGGKDRCQLAGCGRIHHVKGHRRHMSRHDEFNMRWVGHIVLPSFLDA